LVQRTFRLVQPRFSIGVVGVLLDETGSRVLLVEHIFHTHKPWGLPGGWLERGEDPSQTVEREFYEETGLHVQAVRPLLVQRTPEMRAHMDVVYLCGLDDTPQTIRLSHELLSYRWADPDDLPPLVVLHTQAIRAAFEVKVSEQTEVVEWNTDG
jgi:ADP-ribose pyrophosphatase YjhB (NUDIX family)